MNKLKLEIETDLESLMDELADKVNDATLIKLITKLDHNVGNFSFTVKLIKALIKGWDEKRFSRKTLKEIAYGNRSFQKL